MCKVKKKKKKKFDLVNLIDTSKGSIFYCVSWNSAIGL